jgi:hypothetical protein
MEFNHWKASALAGPIGGMRIRDIVTSAEVRECSDSKSQASSYDSQGLLPHEFVDFAPTIYLLDLDHDSDRTDAIEKRGPFLCSQIVVSVTGD